MDARIAAYELAFRMQAEAPDAVDLSKETEATKKLYGMDDSVAAPFGRMCLLSRRLVERGVRFVQLYSGAGSKWDAHSGIEKNHGDRFRETDQPHIKELWEIGDKMAEGAALMTNTKFTSRILGTAYPQHMNRAVAEAMYENIKKVGLPTWSDEDQQLAKGLQKELGNATQEGLATRIRPIGQPNPDRENTGGGSDDIGDVSWNVPTVTLSYPSNIPGLPGHNWSSGIASATPIAHKGVVAGAKVQAMTVLDLMTKPELVKAAWDYFNNVQTKDVKYIPFIKKDTPPATHLNTNTLAKYREQMKKFYYDPTKYKTYLDQLGIKYPTLRTGETPKPQQEQQ